MTERQRSIQEKVFTRTPKKMEANEVQVGGDHYKRKRIQPWDAIVDWKMGFLDGNVVKYIARWKEKGGIEDLKKARHYLDKLIEVELDDPSAQQYSVRNAQL